MNIILTKGYTLNGLIGSALTALYFIAFTPRFFNLSTTYFSRVLRCKIINYVSPSIICHRYILDIIIISERLIYFDKSSLFRYIFKYDSKLVTSLLLTISFIVCLPTVFQLRIRNDYEFDFKQLDYNTLKEFEYCDKEPFSETLLGKGLTLMAFLFRDFFTLIIEILIAFRSLKLYHSFLEKKAAIIPNKRVVTKNSVAVNEERKSRILNKNLTKMTLVMTCGSIFSHTIGFGFALTFLFNRNQPFLFLACIFVILLKNSLNIFFFYFFNKNFKKSIHRVFFSFK